MTDTAVAGGDGHHIIQAGWNGSHLFFYVDGVGVTSDISDKRQKHDVTKLNDKILMSKYSYYLLF